MLLMLLASRRVLTAPAKEQAFEQWELKVGMGDCLASVHPFCSKGYIIVHWCVCIYIVWYITVYTLVHLVQVEYSVTK